jgi:Tol biopolymer transport system component
VYRVGIEETSELTWLDRRGAKVSPAIAEGAFQELRLAPDGRRAAVTMTDRNTGNRDIWSVDLTTGTMTRVTSHPANDWKPTWSRDGTLLAFASDHRGSSTVLSKAIDGSGAEVVIPIASVPGHLFPNDWSPDGQLLAVHSSTPETTLDVWVVSREGDHPREIARSRYQEHSARFSPDGRWIAYVSDESGAPEVYIQALGKAAKRRVSTSGGVGPRWRNDGRELFFIDGANRLMTATVGHGETFISSPPVALFNVCRPSGPEFHVYDVVANGSRSLWICPSPRRPPSLVTVSIAGLPNGNRGN